MLFFTDDVIIMYVANPKESTDKLLQLIRLKQVNLKITLKNHYVFLYSREKEFFPFFNLNSTS